MEKGQELAQTNSGLSSLLSESYTGCQSAVVEGDHVLVTAEALAQASAIVIKRNDVQVFKTAETGKLIQFQDKDVQSGEEYEYSCHAILASTNQNAEVLITGSNKSAVTMSGTRTYLGCKDYSASESQVTLNYEAFVGADKIQILRDGKVVYEHGGADSGSFVDKSVEPGTSYVYSCQALILAKTEDEEDAIFVGAQQFELLTLGTAHTFAGCKEVSATGVDGEAKIVFERTSDGDKYMIYRDGGKIAAIPKEEAAISEGAEVVYIDRSAHAGTRYEYSCSVVHGETETVGKNKPFYLLEGTSLSDYSGCLSAEASSSGEIKISMATHPDATSYLLNRDGKQLAVVSPDSPGASQVSFHDRDISEGVVYDYSCYAQSELRDYPGKHKQSIRAFSSHAPTFAGLDHAEILAGNKIRLSWKKPTGVPASKYDIHFKVGDNVLASTILATAAEASVAAPALSYELGDLGDGLTYSIMVRACSDAGDCDSNSSVKTITMLDAGAPAAVIILGVEIDAGGIYVLAPWDYKHGEVAKRFLYASKGVTAGSTLAEFSVFGVAGYEVSVSDFNAVPTRIKIPIRLEEQSTYHFVVIDEDSKGQRSNDWHAYSYTVGNLYGPELQPQVSGVERGNGEGELNVQWSNSGSLSDVVGYEIFEVVDGVMEKTPLGECRCSGDNCNSSPLNSCIVQGLPAKAYKLTVLALDADGKTSDFDASLVTNLVYAPDHTPPAFSGNNSSLLASFDSSLRTVRLSFNAARDNQYDQSVHAISYDILRYPANGGLCESQDPKTISDFPISEGTIVASGITADENSPNQIISYDASALPNQAYFYRIIAMDQANIELNSRNKTEDNRVVCVDYKLSPPPIFTEPVSIIKSSHDAKEWYLKWDMESTGSGASTKASIKVDVYVYHSSDPDAPKAATPLEVEQSSKYQPISSGLVGVTRFPADGEALIGGEAGKNQFAHYAVVLTTPDGAQSMRKHRVKYQNVIDMTRVSRSFGTNAGGKLVVIEGTGLASDMRIYFGDAADEAKRCANLTIAYFPDREEPARTNNVLYCTTPAWDLGGNNEDTVQVILTDSTGEVIPTSMQTYTFYDLAASGTSVSSPCDSAAYSLLGSGDSESDPYILCDRQSFLDLPDHGATKKYYRLDDHVDFSGSLWTPLVRRKIDMRSVENRQIYYLANVNIALPGSVSTEEEGYTGFFKALDVQSYVRDIGFLNGRINLDPHVSLPYGIRRYYAFFAGCADQGTSIDHVRVSGDITTSGSGNPIQYGWGGLLIGRTIYVDTITNIEAMGKINFYANNSSSWDQHAGSLIADNIGDEDMVIDLAYVHLVSNSWRAAGLVGSSTTLGRIGSEVATSERKNSRIKVYIDLTVQRESAGLVGYITEQYATKPMVVRNVSISGKISENVYYLASAGPGVNSQPYQVGGMFGYFYDGHLDARYIDSDIFVADGSYYMGGMIGLISQAGVFIEPVDGLKKIQITDSRFTGILRTDDTSANGQSGGIIGSVSGDFTVGTQGSWGSRNFSPPWLIQMDRVLVSGNIYAPGRYSIGGMIGILNSKSGAFRINQSAVTGKFISGSRVGGMVGSNLRVNYRDVSQSETMTSYITETLFDGYVECQTGNSCSPAIGENYGHKHVFENNLIKGGIYGGDGIGGLIGYHLGRQSMSHVNVLVSDWTWYDFVITPYSSTAMNWAEGTDFEIASYLGVNNFPEVRNTIVMPAVYAKSSNKQGGFIGYYDKTEAPVFEHSYFIRQGVSYDWEQNLGTGIPAAPPSFGRTSSELAKLPSEESSSFSPDIWDIQWEQGEFNLRHLVNILP